jgi:glycosyltransferase involved in cell wall biosynthesis
VNEPSVCAVMLTANRPEMARQAIECFRRQTYFAKTLLIVNSGANPMIPTGYAEDIMEPCYVGADAQTIGELRNRGNRTSAGHGTDIVIHWDDDDYSRPNRIAEQVALLQSSGADCVGYNELLFWREVEREAWLYRSTEPNYALGTSLCYWRKTWERKPFEATSQGEDRKFLMSAPALKCVAISANPVDDDPPLHCNEQPRMIARIHPGNTSQVYDPVYMRVVEKQGGEWKRVPFGFRLRLWSLP